tara:strand:- start:1824 stop:1994 length:171 start_codon:yes stop_codon:yes gene_type:complete
MRYFIGIIAIIFVSAFVGSGDYQDAVAMNAHHCEMVGIWKRTGGEAGHPNYDGRHC